MMNAYIQELPRTPVLSACLAAIALWSSACFNPSYPENLPCDQDGWCPPGQECNSANMCVPGSGGSDVDASLFDAPPPPLVTGIDIGPDVTLSVGEIHQFDVVLIYDDDSTQPIANPELVIWRSTDNAIAWLDFNGVATAASAGMVTITGRYEGLVDAAVVTVNAP